MDHSGTPKHNQSFLTETEAARQLLHRPVEGLGCVGTAGTELLPGESAGVTGQDHGACTRKGAREAAQLEEA